MSDDYCLKDAPRAKEDAPCVKNGATSNSGIQCPEEGRDCDHCGFNPAVARARLKKMPEKMRVVPDKKTVHVRKPNWGTNYEDVQARCPFYNGIDNKNKYILCSGPVKRTSLMMHFTRREEFLSYSGKKCKGHYPDCRLYQVMNGR